MRLQRVSLTLRSPPRCLAGAKQVGSVECRRELSSGLSRPAAAGALPTLKGSQGGLSPVLPSNAACAWQGRRHAGRQWPSCFQPSRPEERHRPAGGAAGNETAPERRAALRHGLWLFGALLARRVAPAPPWPCPLSAQGPCRCISTMVVRGAHAVLLPDRAGWPTTGRLAVRRLTDNPGSSPQSEGPNGPASVRNEGRSYELRIRDGRVGGRWLWRRYGAGPILSSAP